MNSSNLLIIVAAEVALLLLVICVFLGIQNHSLRKLVAQLKEKAKDVLNELKQAKQNASQVESPAEEPVANETPSYEDYVEKQIALTRDYHGTLNSGQDIVLDIAPESPLLHRTPALRHAVLLAEKNALAMIQNAEAPDWEELGRRYETIFNFYEDYTEDTEAQNSGDLEALQLDLDNAQQRVKNLEKFKDLYFDIEEKWKSAKGEAKTHFDNLSALTNKLDNGDAVQTALQNYHECYNGVTQLFDQSPDVGAETNDKKEGRSDALDAAAEIYKLREVAADQHRIIEDLQTRLMSATTEGEMRDAVQGLQGELQKQMRFVQESETCIQLLEDELNEAHRQVEISKAKLSKLPEIKSDYIDLRRQYDEIEMKYHQTVSENRKLNKKLQANKTNNSEMKSAVEAKRLRKALAEVSLKYNNLEEKFLELKMQQ